jgi:hypothetical protein
MMPPYTVEDLLIFVLFLFCSSNFSAPFVFICLLPLGLTYSFLRRMAVV